MLFSFSYEPFGPQFRPNHKDKDVTSILPFELINKLGWKVGKYEYIGSYFFESWKTSGTNKFCLSWNSSRKENQELQKAIEKKMKEKPAKHKEREKNYKNSGVNRITYPLLSGKDTTVYN